MGPAGAGPISIKVKQGVEKRHERRQDKKKIRRKSGVY
jgi:hypothetical protein